MVLFRIVLIALCVCRCSGTLNDQCVTNFKMIDCKNIEILKPFGNDGTYQVHTIKIDSCDIENNSIDDNDLHSFSILNTLIISNSSLSAVGKSVFSKLTKLDVVVIENTEWILVHPGQFKNNVHLRELHLSHNKITSIPEDTFPLSLTVLDLSYNRIANISRFAFKDLLSLQQLKLTGNLLTSLHSDLGFPSSLKHLYVDSNNILKVEPFTFSNCIYLEELSLSFNQLHSIPDDIFHGLHNLATLRLDNNLISQMSLKLFSQLDSLMFLFLHRNKLKHTDLNELQINSIMQLHIDSYLLEDNLKRVSYFPKFDGIIYTHIRVSEYQDIVLSFKSGCASENCDDVIKKSTNHEVLRCPDEETCFLKIPNVFGRTDDQRNANYDFNNYLRKDNCSCIVNESNYYGLIMWNNIVTYLIAFVLYSLYLIFQNKNKILNWILKNESNQTHSSNSSFHHNDSNKGNENEDEDYVSIECENQESSELLPSTHTSRSQSFLCSADLSDVSRNDELDSTALHALQYSKKPITGIKMREESGDTSSSNTQGTLSAFCAVPAQLPARLSSAVSQANVLHVPASEISSMIPVTSATDKYISNAFPQGNFSTFPTVSSPRSVDLRVLQGAERQDCTERFSVPPKVLFPHVIRYTPQASKVEDYEDHVEKSSVLATKLFKSTVRNPLPQASANNDNYIIAAELPFVIAAELPPQLVERQDDTESLKEKMSTTTTTTSTLSSTTTTLTHTPTTSKQKKNSEPPRRRTISDFRNEEGELFKVLRRVRSDLERKLGEEVPSQLDPKPLQPPPPASTPHARNQPERSQPPSAPSSGKRTPNERTLASVRNVPVWARPASQPTGTSPPLIILRKESSVGSGLHGAATPTASQSALTKPAAPPGTPRKGAFAQTSQRVGPMSNHGTSSKTHLKIENLIDVFERNGRQ